MSRKFRGSALLCAFVGLIAACHAQAPAAGPEQYRACAHDDECVVTSSNCCNACEPISAERLLAVSKASQSAEFTARCPVIPPCAPCAPNAEQGDGTGKYFVAACVAGRCEVRDQRAASATRPDRAGASL